MSGNDAFFAPINILLLKIHKNHFKVACSETKVSEQVYLNK